jgi:hypothetical protein
MASTAPLGKLARDGEDLAFGIAGIELVGRREIGARAALVNHGDDDLRASGTQPARLAGDGLGERQEFEPSHVGRQGRARRRGRDRADEADLDASGIDDGGRLEVGPRHRLAGLVVHDVRRQEGKVGLGGACLERAARIVTGPPARARARPGRNRIRDCRWRRAVAQGIVGAHHGRALGQVRFQRALKHVARIEQDHRAAGLLPNLAQVLQVAPEPRQGGDVPVQVARAHHRDGHLARRRRVRGGGEGNKGEEGQKARMGSEVWPCNCAWILISPQRHGAHRGLRRKGLPDLGTFSPFSALSVVNPLPLLKSANSAESC